MKKRLIGFASAIVLSGLSGCAGNMDNNAADTNRNVQTQRVRTNMVNDNNATNNQNFRQANQVERSIEQLGEVSQARVFVNGDNAYVAVRLNNNRATQQRTNTSAGNRPGISNIEGYKNNTGTGAETGRITRTRNEASINGNRYNTGTGAETGRVTGKGNRLYDLNTGSAGNIGLVPPPPTGNRSGMGYLPGYDVGNNNISGANVGNARGNGHLPEANVGNTNGYNMIMNNQTGVGRRPNVFSQNTNNTISESLERKIKKQVRVADSQLRDVYISVDNGMFNTMDNYSNDLRNGRNRDGFENFNETIQRMFGRE